MGVALLYPTELVDEDTGKSLEYDFECGRNFVHRFQEKQPIDLKDTCLCQAQKKRAQKDNQKAPDCNK